MRHKNQHEGQRIPARGYAFQEIMLERAERMGARIIEHPITFRDRIRGTSKLGWSDIREFFVVLAQTWWSRGKLPHPDGIITWSRLPRPDRRFTLALGCIVLVLTGLPILFGYLNTPDGFVYTGIQTLTPGDNTVYYSYIDLAKDGHVLLPNRYAYMPEGAQAIGRGFHPVWYGVGVLARVLNIAPPAALHLARLLLVVPFTMFLGVFVAAFIHPREQWGVLRRPWRLALILTIFGAGTGALLGLPAVVVSSVNPQAALSMPMDLWVPDAFPLLAMMRSPHFIVSLWLTLGVYLATIRADQTQRTRWTVLAALSGAFLFAMHPFFLALVPPLLVIYCCMRMLLARRWLAHLMLHCFWFCLAALPAFTYWGLLALLDPVHRSIAAQNVLPTPSLGITFLSYGFLLVGAIFGAYELIKRTRQNIPALFLVSWMIGNMVLLYAPIPWQRRFVQGFSVVLAIATVYGIAWLLAFLAKRVSSRVHPYLFSRSTAWVVLVLLFFTSSIVNVGRDFWNYSLQFVPPRTYLFYYPEEGIHSLTWFREHTPPNAHALALLYTAAYLPGWSGRASFIGHNLATPNIEQRRDALMRFMDPGATPDERIAFLKRYHITHLIDADFETRSDALRSAIQSLSLNAVYTNARVTIYETAPLVQ